MHITVGTPALETLIYFGLKTKKCSFHVYKVPMTVITIFELN